MDIPKEFLENFETGNLIKIRISLLNYLRMNKINDFKNCLEYCKEKGVNIIDTNNEFSFNINKDKWDEKYLEKLYYDLKYNFSEERIKHILDVKAYLNKNIGKNQKKISMDKNNILIGTGVATTIVGIISAKAIIIGAGVIIGGLGIVRRINANQ